MCEDRATDEVYLCDHKIEVTWAIIILVTKSSSCFTGK